jgi:hypothetical protein
VICQVEIDWIKGRSNEIATMLTPLTGTGPRRVASEPRNISGNIFIYAYSGLRPAVDYRDWRFKTITYGIRGSYFELWKPSDEKRHRYYLDRAYLSLYLQVKALDREKELLALHCDPNEPDDAGELKHALYKRGPHIHVSAAEDPLPHSHFALNAGNLNEVLKSAESLYQAMQSGMVLLRDQVLDVFDSRA